MFVSRPKNLALFLLMFLSSVYFGCGTAGVSSDQFSDGFISEVRGSIVGSTGAQQAMFGYIMVLVERDTGISRVSRIDEGGIFVFNQVKANVPQTLILLNSSYRISSVLSITGLLPETIRQFFIPQSSYLPRLVHKGSIVFFEDESRLNVTPDTAADANGNGIPAGIDPEEGGGLQLVGSQTSVRGLALKGVMEGKSFSPIPGLKQGLRLVTGAPDTNGNGIPNLTDHDIDGDGIINWFDIDMDGNPPIDIFDPDADDDTYLDDFNDPTLKNRYEEGIEFFAVTVEQGPGEGNNVIETAITLQTKLREPAQKVEVDGPNSLFGGSCYRRKVNMEGAEEGSENVENLPQTSCIGYDKRLRDDGLSNDGGVEDGHYAQTFILRAGNKPVGHQAIFLKLDYGNNFFKFYPYVFSPVTLGTFKILFDGNSKRFQRTPTSNPFGTAFTHYKWEVKIFDGLGKQVWSSGPMEAAQREVRINADEYSGILNAAKTDMEEAGTTSQALKAVGYAYSLQKVPGYPAYVVRSESIDLQ